jgi:acetylornithine/N-succinyldiaminopimelate aminotransferase
MSVEAIEAEERELLMQTFKRLPIELVRGAGARVYDTDGREYLDFVAGIAVNVLGHGHPALVKAIQEQAATLIHASDLYYTRPQVDLARRLREMGFDGRLFAANSGAEANECAVKIARKFGKLHRSGAYEVITAEGSFHGRTLAMIAAAGQAKVQAGFEPMPDGFQSVPFNDIDALRAATSDKTVAVMLEPVQGEVGVIPAREEYLRDVRAWCDEQGLLLIFDEVQTGIGRTGTFYAFQGYGVVPDILTLAKGLGGGVPIGVCLAGPRADCLAPGEHGSTFGGNPLACAAALAVVDAIEAEGVVENARDVGAYLGVRLQGLAGDFDCIVEVRGRGLMQAMVLDRDIAVRVQDEALQQGLLVNATGPKVVRFVPPLIITREDVDQAIAVLAASLDLALQ